MRRIRAVCAALLLLAAPASAQFQGPAGPYLDNALSGGATGSGMQRNAANATLPDAPINLGISPLPVSAYGAVCDGVTDESALIQAAMTANKNVALPPNKVCVAKNLVTVGDQVFDLNGSSLRAASGASYVLKLTGYGSMLRGSNGQIEDPSNYTLTATTLSSTASPGATSITVATPSGPGFLVGTPIAITLDSGSRWTTKVTTVTNNGNGTYTIGILDAIPYSATAVAINAAGTGAATNDSVMVGGGTGAPMNILVTAQSGGVPSAVSIAVPGLYSAIPDGNATYDGSTTTATGLTLTLTFAGAASGKAVEAAEGLLVLDQYPYMTATDFRVVNAPVGIHVKNTGTGATQTSKCTIRNVKQSAIRLVGVMKDVNVSDCALDDIISYGSFSSPAFGAVGLYVDGTTPGSIATGGNFYSKARFLQYEIGVLARNAQLDQFVGVLSDTVRNYAFLLDHPVKLNFGGTTWGSFAGPSALSGTGNQGFGLVAIVPTSVRLEKWNSYENFDVVTSDVTNLTFDGMVDLFGATVASVSGGAQIFGPIGITTGGVATGWPISQQNCKAYSLTDFVGTAPGAGNSNIITLKNGNSSSWFVETMTGASAFGAAVGNGLAPYPVSAAGTITLAQTGTGSPSATSHRYAIKLRC